MKQPRGYFIFIFFLFSSLISIADNGSIKYFILNDGTKQNFTKFDHISGDTLYFINQDSLHSISVDSISRIYVINRARQIEGRIIGFLGGAIVGVALGEMVSTKDEKTLGEVSVGLIGGIVGAIFWSGKGIIHPKGRDIRLKNYTRKQKIEIIPIVLKDE